MSVWCIKDVVDILKEGVPGVDMETLYVNSTSAYGGTAGLVNNHLPNYVGGTAGGLFAGGISSTSYDEYLNVAVLVKLPIDKIGEVSINGLDLNSLIYTSIHPELNNGTNYVSFNNSWSITGTELKLNITLNLKVSVLGQTARTIRDSNFYSLLDATLES